MAPTDFKVFFYLRGTIHFCLGFYTQFLFPLFGDIVRTFIGKNCESDEREIRNPPVNEDLGNEYEPMEYPNGRRDAVSVRNACKTFDKRKKDPMRVLRNLNMTVKEGTIYTLLGSSGCGKTTLLSCVVGMTKLDEGECKIFGLKPGTSGSGVPGKRVGYMCQEIALYGEFTIKEALQYFGRIYGMSVNKIEDRMTFLIKFLHLPPSYRIIRSLSGGQQRRVSFAVALLHEPELLILDEPTVGVDPVLRKNIWKHLREQADAKGTTVIITTHYIEEATEANCIALMRSGRLLAEDSPQGLLEKHNCTKLEEVFYKLCACDMKLEDTGVPVKNGTAEVVRDQSTPVVQSEAPPQNDSHNITPAQNETPKRNGVLKARTGVRVRNDTENGRNLSGSEEEDESRSGRTGADITNENYRVEVCNETNRNRNGVIPVSGIASPTTPVFNRSVETLITSVATPANNNQHEASNGRSVTKQNSTIDKETSKKKTGDDCKSPGWLTENSDYWNIMRALLFKNFLCMWRNIGFVIFIYILPAVQAVLFCLAIGGNPTKLPMGIVNFEVNQTLQECRYSGGCTVSNLSCKFIDKIPSDTITFQHIFENENKALEYVKNGKIWGYLVIPANFSNLMLHKGVQNLGLMYQEGFQGMHVNLHLDMTSQQIAFSIQQAISLAFQEFTKRNLIDCGVNQPLDLPSTSFIQPIYGTNKSSFREFMAPGIILSIIFFMSVALTGSAFITEKKEGMLTRTIVSGVSTGQIITAHMITQYITMSAQTVLVLVVMLFVFKIQIIGSVLLVVVLTLAQGTCGMAYGFLISVLCTDERNAIQMALGSFYPNLLLSGVVWPLESIPWYLRQVALFLPQTMACEAMRSIFSRGWTIDHPKVWPGFVASIIWSGIFWMLALMLARLRNR